MLPFEPVPELPELLELPAVEVPLVGGAAWCPGKALATYTPKAPTVAMVATPIPAVMAVRRSSAASRRVVAMRRRWAGVACLIRAMTTTVWVHPDAEMTKRVVNLRIS